MQTAMIRVICVFCSAIVAATPGLRAADSPITFGERRMEFPKKFALPGAKEQEKLGDGWWRNADLRHVMGRDFPLLEDVEACEARRWGSGDELPHYAAVDILFSRHSLVYARPTWQSIGYFLKPIENARQFEWVLWLLHKDWQKERLSGEQIREIFRTIESDRQGVPLRILVRRFDGGPLSKGGLATDGIWIANFALIEETSVVEYEYAIDKSNHVARRRTVLVQGPPLPHFEPVHNGIAGLATAVIEEHPVWDVYSRSRFLLLRAAYLSDWKQAIAKLGPLNSDELLTAIAENEDAVKQAMPELINALGDRDKHIRFAAAEILLRAARPAEKAVPALRKALSDTDSAVRCSAAVAILKIGPADLRVEAARALGGMGNDAADAICRLHVAENDDHREFRQAALQAIDRIQKSQDDLADSAAVDAAKALKATRQRIGNGDVPGLLKALLNPSLDVRQEALHALCRMGARATAAVPELRKWLREGGEKTPLVDAACILGCMGADANEAVPELRHLLAHRFVQVRSAAAEAIGKIGPAAKSAIPDLKYALTDPSPEVRRLAAVALGNVGVAATGGAIPENTGLRKQ